jgi:hypothetical protein
MNHTAKEIESGAIQEIKPEVRTLFTKVVERDPREAAKMLEPYPDEFVVQMLELLNPASALKILQRRTESCTHFGILVTRRLPYVSSPVRMRLQQLLDERSDGGIVDRHLQQRFYNTQ